MSEEAKQETLSEQLLKRAAVTRFDLEQVLIVPLLAVVAALIIGGLIMVATGVSLQSIAQSYLALFTGSLGSVYAVSETLTAATP